MTDSPPPAKLDLIAATTFGLEAVVARELEALGYAAKIIQSGRVLFSGDAADVCRANLWLRAADRVLLRVGGFEARDFGALFDRTFALPWEAWIPADAEFPVSGRSIKSQLSSVPACQKIVKKAIVEKLKSAYGVDWFAETGREVLHRSGAAGGPGDADHRHQRPGAAQAGLPAAGRQGAAEGDVGRRLGAAELLESGAAAGRSVLRLRDDPHRGGDDRPQHGARPATNVSPPSRGRRFPRRCGNRPARRRGSRPGPTCRSASSPPT